MTQASPIPSPGPSLFVTPAEVCVMYPATRAKARQVQIARRPTPQQGIALEILGHAIEYLVDSNFYHQRAHVPAVKEAIAILKQSNREVFAEAPEAVPAGTRAVRWMRSHLPAQELVPASQPATPVRLILVKR